MLLHLLECEIVIVSDYVVNEGISMQHNDKYFRFMLITDFYPSACLFACLFICLFYISPSLFVLPRPDSWKNRCGPG